jgi:dUTP pyrophosphatase
MKIQIKKLEPEAIIPHFSQAGDVAMDLFSVDNIILKPGQKMSCRTGIAIKIPDGYVALIWDKSGPSHKFGIKTLGGVMDSNYVGEYLVGLINLGQEDFEIKKGQKIAQVLFQKIEIPKIEEVDELPETNRGDGKFGSTGIFLKYIK